MNLLIDKNLRELRKNRGTRQEDLAEHLGVSVQSVSKWEHGENLPDLTLIPAIASYYDVTVDDLLGVGEIRKKEKIKAYEDESNKLRQAGKIPEDVALWRNAIKEFPNDHKVMSELAHALSVVNPRTESNFKEAAELSERILRESTDQELRDGAIQTISYAYDELGDREKAKEYAYMASSIWFSRESILSSVLKGDEGVRFNQGYVCTLLDILGYAICGIDTVDWLTRHEFYIKLLEYVFDDGFMGFYAIRAASQHHFCAKIYASRGDEEKARYHLESAVKYAKQFDGLGSKYTYHSTVLNGLTGSRTSIETNTEDTVCKQHLNRLYDSGSGVFDPCRDTDWFKAVIKSLESEK